ncbi:hypothetical protein BAE44_0013388 [Dichanthelium oligosanthes]|uniref:Uncharacterized protein n=1 Tax=Dichanthelium oligosanthes TaxID=888268 RepID=A0A1E5VKJ3_9POAL|nr:hypothetical protein BAE44_0013388 [Dichanthelium oligosanthes]
MALSKLQARAPFVQSSAASAGVHLDEDRWLSRVRQTLEREASDALAAAAKVFDVPRVLRATRPAAYLPQHFALGPYHCNRPELRDMERYKLAAAKRAEKLFADGKKFDHLVQRLLEAQDKMRAPNVPQVPRAERPDAGVDDGHRHLLPPRLPRELPPRRGPRAPPPHRAGAAGAVHAVLDRFIEEVSPIKTAAELVIDDVAKHAHMLELLYHFLVPDAAVFDADGDREPPPLVTEEFTIDMLDPSQQLPDYDKVKQAFVQVSSLDVAPVRFLKKNLISRPMSMASSLPVQIMRKMPVLSAVAPLVTKLMASTDVEARLKGVTA